MRLNRYKFSIHPLYFCLLLYYVVIGKFWLFISNLLAVLWHEFAHAYVAKNCGYEMKKIVLMPYGAMLYGEERFYGRDCVRIAMAGPFSSLLMSVVTLGVWWLIPDMYNYLSDFLTANVVLAAFNLLPCFPLDGARVILGMTDNKMKALRWLKLSGAFVSMVMIVLGIASFWYTPNITLISVGAFLLIGAFTGSKKEEYYFIASRMSFAKDYMRGVTSREIRISDDVKIYMLLRHISERYLTIFVVVDSNGLEIVRFGEGQLEELLINSPGAIRVADIINNNYLIK